MDQEPLISAAYAEQNRLLHEQREGYGANGGRYAEHVYGLLAVWHPRTLLDYGCGKGGLRETLREMIADRKPQRPKISKARGARHQTMGVSLPEWTGYDPAIPGVDTLPHGQFDMTVCTDVLEHVEPEHIGRTMATISRLTGKLAFLTFSLRESNKTLPDGRNTHLLVKPKNWWHELALQNFAFVSEVPWRNSETYMLVAFK